MDKKNKMFNRSLLFGLFLFSLMIAWMSYDIFSRDGIIGGNTNVLIMGTNAGFKPFEYKEGENVVGFDVDLAKEIAKELGKELKIEDMAFDGLLPALDSGQIDMAIAGMSVTPERQKNVLFSNPYYSAAQKIIVREGSDIRNKYQLEGKHLGVQLGTTGDTLANKINNVRVSQFPTAPSVLQELSTGGVDAVILDDAPANRYLNNFNNLKILTGSLSDEQYAIAIKKGNSDLQAKANKVIDDMKKDGRYQKLLDKYFSSDKNKDENNGDKK